MIDLYFQTKIKAEINFFRNKSKLYKYLEMKIIEGAAHSYAFILLNYFMP